MSVTQNQTFQVWDFAYQSLVSCEFTRDGARLSQRDRDTWAEALILTAIVWSDLYSSVSTRSLCDWLLRVARIDVIEVCKVFKDADWLLTHYIVAPIPDDPIRWFKTQLYADHSYAGVILGPVAKFIDEFLVDMETREYRTLHQALSFISRVTLRDYDDPQAFSCLKEHDEGLSVTDWFLVDRMNTIMREWLDGFCVNTYPNHGSGAIADSKDKSRFSKYKLVGIDPLLTYVLRKYWKGPGNWTDLVPPGGLLRTFERKSRFRQVPKNALKRRNICMESATLQYFQQMVKNSLYDWLRSNLRHRIDLEDATKNAELAREGSISGYLSTIDLSAASDSVQWDLVRRAFRNTPLLPWLYATRSRKIERSERGGAGADAFIPRMFAPMGSALCFPVECLVFASVCEDACRVTHTRSLYRVYGDDIVIETWLVPFVTRRLKSLGFQVNEDKSFTDNSPRTFRESCGGEYFDGVDVTPVRIPRKFQGGPLRPSRVDVYQSFVKLANAFYERGLVGARRWIIRRLRALGPHLFPKFDSSGSHLLGDSSRNYMSGKVSWNRRLQRLEIETCVPTMYWSDRSLDTIVNQCSDVSYEEVRLYDWYLRAASRSHGRSSFLAMKYFDSTLPLGEWCAKYGPEPETRIYSDGLMELESSRVALIP